jgi:hypothetical protein
MKDESNHFPARQKEYMYRMTKQQAIREQYCQQHGMTLELECLLQMRCRGVPALFQQGTPLQRIRVYPEFATAENALTRIQWAELKAQYNHECLRCHRSEPEIELVADHVLPKSKGGATTAANTQPLCRSCNASKNNKHIDYRPQFSELI